MGEEVRTSCAALPSVTTPNTQQSRAEISTCRAHTHTQACTNAHTADVLDMYATNIYTHVHKETHSHTSDPDSARQCVI